MIKEIKGTQAVADIAPAVQTAAEPARDAESDRRLATILFADLSGFTSISEGLDPEDVRALQNDLLDTLRAILDRYDAFVEKFVGDAVMAVFGAPTAHEDDPKRRMSRTSVFDCSCMSASIPGGWSPVTSAR